MPRGARGWGGVCFSLALAAGLWWFTFTVPWGVFWYKISFSAGLLAGLGLWLRPAARAEIRFDPRAWLLGPLSAALLYGIFWLGQLIAKQLLGFAAGQIGGIYALGQGTPLWLVALLLFFVTSPSEEIFWRGYLQAEMQQRLGPWPGFWLAWACYTAVHVWTLNFMLVGAAGVAAAFWGLMYWRTGYLGPQIISHAVWTAVIFALFPLH